MSRNLTKSLSLVAVCGLGIALLSPLTHAGIITVPTSLTAGEMYRLAFVTSTTRDATSSNIADYNDFVTTAANTQAELVSLSATWNAIASTPTMDAINNTGTSGGGGVPIFLLDDTLFADNYGDLWDGGIHPPFSITESADVYSGADTYVWTGTGSDGTGFSGQELGGLGNPVVGRVEFPDAQWIIHNAIPNSAEFSMYALSDVLTVSSATAAVPEPGSVALLGFLSCVWCGRRIVRRRKRLQDHVSTNPVHS